MSIWAEAWDLPHVATPGRKVAWLPVTDYRFGKHADAFREEGSITIPTGFARLNEVLFVDPDNHVNDVGSVIHLFQRGKVGADGKPNPVGSFVPERRPDNLGSKATGETQFSGRGLTAYFLDRVRLWAYDYPANPTKEDDWIFGGENILSNPGMEDGSGQGAEWLVWLDDGVNGGTWRFQVGGEQTAPLDWDATTTEIGDAIVLAISGLISVSVTGDGSEDTPWKITVTDPVGDDPGATFPNNMTAIDVDLTGGSINYETVRFSGALELSGWMRSTNLDRGTEHGTYASDGFRLTTAGEPVRTGSYALRVNGLTRFAGAMQVVSVIPGHRYTASIWAYTSSATNIFRFVIRDRFEGFIGGPDGLGGRTLTINTWTEFTYTFVAPTDQIIFRFAVVGDTVAGASVNPSPFYLDDGFLAPGEVAATIGYILTQMLLDASTNHFVDAGRDALDFLNLTFTATLDSASVAWDTTRSMTLTAGDTYGQIVEAIQRLWGYVIRIRFDRETNIYHLDAFNPGYSIPATADSGSAIVGMNVLSGEVVSRAPEGAHIKVFTDEGVWDEGTETDLLGPWGWADAKFEKVATGDTNGLAAIITQQLARMLDQVVSFEFAMTSQGQVVPFQDFDVFGELLVNLGASSPIPAADRIVTSIVCGGKPGQAPNYQVHVNSDAFASTGAAALAEAVRRLLRKSQRDKKDYGGSIQAGLGGVPTIFVAASDASAKSRSLADYLAGSSNADQAIATAADDLAVLGGGRLVLSEGLFSGLSTSGWNIPIPSNSLVIGFIDTLLRVNPSLSGNLFTRGSNVTFQDFRVEDFSE